MKQPLLVLTGPTAVGKTALGIELAKRFNGEIISGDSQQVYRQLNIGTAKATPEEQAAAVHHLIDVRDVDESYSGLSPEEFLKDLIDLFHLLAVSFAKTDGQGDVIV